MSVDVPKVYCSAHKEYVPIWYCTGSFTQKRKMCIKLKELIVDNFDNTASVLCKK